MSVDESVSSLDKPNFLALLNNVPNRQQVLNKYIHQQMSQSNYMRRGHGVPGPGLSSSADGCGGQLALEAHAIPVRTHLRAQAQSSTWQS